MNYNTITFGEYFKSDNSGAESTYQILKDTESEILNNLKSKQSKADLKKLEDTLTKLFYDESYRNERYPDFEQQLAQAYESTYKQKLADGLKTNTWDFGKGEIIGAPKMNVVDWSKIEDSSRQRIEVHRAQRLIDQVNKILTVGSVSNMNKELEMLVQQGKILLEQALQEKLQGTSIESLDGRRYITKLDNNLKNIIARLIALEKSAKIATNQMVGQMFEVCLQIFSQDIVESGYNLTQDLIDKFTSQVTGMNTEISGMINWGIKSDTVVKDKKNKKESKKYTTRYTKDNLTVSYDKQEKQIKMDVQIQIPTIQNNEEIRFSAKSWISGYHNIGSTSLEHALNRTLSSAQLEARALMAMQNIGRGHDNYSEAAMHLAKLCIYADIISGYSQQSGYANTLIINDRANKRIRVYDINDLIYNAFKGENEEEISIKQIEEFNSIPEVAMDYRNAVIGEMRAGAGRSGTYLARLRARLQALKLEVDLEQWSS